MAAKEKCENKLNKFCLNSFVNGSEPNLLKTDQLKPETKYPLLLKMFPNLVTEIEFLLSQEKNTKQTKFFKKNVRFNSQVAECKLPSYEYDDALEARKSIYQPAPFEDYLWCGITCQFKDNVGTYNKNKGNLPNNSLNLVNNSVHCSKNQQKDVLVTSVYDEAKDQVKPRHTYK